MRKTPPQKAGSGWREAIRNTPATAATLIPDSCFLLHAANDHFTGSSASMRRRRQQSLDIDPMFLYHEINNPLSGILLFTTCVRKEIKENGPVKQCVDIVILDLKLPDYRGRSESEPF